MVDVFEEVDEHLRSDQFARLARRALPVTAGVLALALVGALGTWAYLKHEAAGAQRASQDYASGLEALGRGDVNNALTAFGKVETSPSAAYRALAFEQEAGIRLDQGKRDDAVRLLDRAADQSKVPAIADEARLKAALLLVDTAPLSDLEPRLKPLADSKRPYAPLAREALAIARLKAGKANDARSDFVVLSLMADAPEDVRDRAKVAMMMIDAGRAGGLQALVDAAAKAPPLPAPPASVAAGAPAPSQDAGDGQ